MALNGLLAPALVYPALTRTPPVVLVGGVERFATVFPDRHPGSDLGCAAAIGYMAFDLGSMVVGYAASVEANGKFTYWLYVWHHLLSILFWPVAILNSSFVYFVDWFVASECSSSWLAIRGAMLALDTINTPLGVLVQLAFVASFFAGRIVVMPDLIRSLLRADWGAVPAWQARLAACTVPIPFALNAHWGIMIARSVVKVATGGGAKGKKKKFAEKEGEREKKVS
jgi:hypothetical protein